jgi:SAM-dependent methyltransferase
MSDAFDYQRVIFGAGRELRREDRNLGGVRLDRALRALEAEPGARAGRILEAGCGVGRFTAPLAAHLPQARIAAVDLSAAAVAEAARRGGTAAYAVADALALPYAVAAFDAVLFFDLLEHLAQPEVALAEFSRVLRPGGLLHGYVPCEGQPPALHWLLGRWVQRWTARHAGHVAHYRHAEVVALAKGAGFEVVGVQYSYHLLGQALDVATFAAREVVFRQRSGSQERPEAYYDRSVLGGGGLGRLYGALRRVVEAAAYVEARLLGWCPWALGMHLTARRG